MGSPGRGVVEGLSTPQVCEFAEVPSSTLDYWATTGLVGPSLAPSCGKRFTRYWSIADAVTARAIRALREAGCPLQKVREAKAVIRGWGEDLDRMVLYWDGADILALEQWGTVRSVVTHPGQQVLHLVALPIPEWWDEARTNATPVDLEEMRGRRQKRMPTTTPSKRLAT